MVGVNTVGDSQTYCDDIERVKSCVENPDMCNEDIMNQMVENTFKPYGNRIGEDFDVEEIFDETEIIHKALRG